MGFRALLLTRGIMFAILVNASSVLSLCSPNRRRSSLDDSPTYPWLHGHRSVILFTVDNQGVCRAGQPPPTHDYNYTSNARGVGNLSGATQVFFSPEGLLYVVRGSELYSGPKPSDPSKDWFQGPGRRVGKAGWGAFKRLFFHPNGDLYAVTHGGELYAGPPPTNENQVWKDALGKKVGNGVWDGFHALFFDPQGILHAVTADDRFVKGSPPTSANDNWIARSQAIGPAGWINLSRFMSFTPDGNLWCVSKSDGKIYRASPPTWGDNWIGRAQNLGVSYFFKFMAFARQ